MNRGSRYTKAFVVVLVLLVGIYDAIALFVWGTDATISRVVGVDSAFASPLIPFAFGFVMGHLFWHQTRKQIANG